MRRRRSTSTGQSPRATSALRTSSVVMESEVSGVLIWCEMSARASASDWRSRARSSAARVRRAVIFCSSDERMASSPSSMRSRSSSRSPCRTPSIEAAKRASAR